MFALTNRPDMGARLYSRLVDLASDAEQGTDVMKLIQYLSGVMLETYLVFEHPDESMETSLRRLSVMLECEPAQGELKPGVLPPANIIDLETERGRLIARLFFEEWLDCEFEFHELMLIIIHNIFIAWENDGLPRAESLRLLVECLQRCLAFETAAQELCDVVIDRKVASQGWGLDDCIVSLSAVAGRRLANSLRLEGSYVFRGGHIPDNLDHIVHVMTQEAVRLGVPAGSDWRFGLAANDVPVNEPIEFIMGIEPYCKSFFEAIGMHDDFDQAVACAKAAGRMIAVAAGGEAPEMEPVIAKPLAMSAITETYKSVCLKQVVVSL